jgi:hypothetical protein
LIVSINQPAYLPWLGYFHRIAASDVHVVLDHVQLEKNSFTNRNKIRTANGWCWLTVPVKTKGRFGDLAIRAVEIEGAAWRKKHWETIKQSYARAPFFAQYGPAFEALYARDWAGLSGLCGEATRLLLDAFGIRTRLMRSSEMDPQGAKDTLVLDLCRKAGATTYLSGALGREYLREELFDEAGIRVVYQDYQHPVYTQAHSGAFEPFMAAVDLLFNHGPEGLAILMRGQRPLAT